MGLNIEGWSLVAGFSERQDVGKTVRQEVEKLRRLGANAPVDR